MTDQTLELDTDAVATWMSQRTDISGPLQASLISGGRSNLTYHLTDAEGREFVLRRPPMGELLPGAHDMEREHRIMAALDSTTVAVPPVIGLCTQPDVLGADFYVTGFVDGMVVRTADEAKALPLPVRGTVTAELARSMAALHALDPQQVGLGDRSKGENYLARQLHVWKRNLDHAKARELPTLDQVHQRLDGAVPPQQSVSIVHGDYRLDNVMITRDGTVAAVLDWELWTLGDPLADLAITMTYWTDSADSAASIIGRPTTAPGFGDRMAYRQAYIDAGGAELPDNLLSYYLAFGMWRLAAILEGVYQRNRAGAYGDGDDTWKSFEEEVPRLGETASRYADEAGI